MSGATLRSRIHSTWEAFFPSSLYFAIFALAAMLILPDVAGTERLAEIVDWMRAFKDGESYALLKEFELHKAIPFIAVLVIAALIYLFDRIATFVGNVAPPFVIWVGSPILYAPAYLVNTLWATLPEGDRDRPLDLHVRARAIIDTALMAGQTLPSSSREYLQQRRNRAGAGLNYAKTGAIWIMLLFLGGFFVGRGPAGPSVGWGVVFIIGFLVIGLVSLVRMTAVMIESNDNDLYIAANLMRTRAGGDLGVVTDSTRIQTLREELAEARSHAPKMVQLTWRRSGGGWSRLRYAFFGFPTAQGKGRISSGSAQAERG